MNAESPNAPPAAERLARATLTRVAEPGDVELAAFVAKHGAPEACAAIRSGDYPGRGATGYRLRIEEAAPERDLAEGARKGLRLICPGDVEWPEQLDDLTYAALLNGRGGPPLALWLRGGAALNEAVTRSCAVVGSRAASEYGGYVAAELAAGLADRSISVVSGGAVGIDAAAHRGALAGDGVTVAVLASGADVAYPRSHERLFDRVAEAGLLVSEVAPGMTPTRPRFLIRNRLIAALSQGAVVVEAALRSGALNTATWANECHRELMVVPGPVTSPLSAGAHELVRAGRAMLVTDAAEVAEQIGALGADLAPVKRGAERPRDELDSTAVQVLEAVPISRAKGAAGIATEAGLAVPVVIGTLERLCQLDYVERRDDGWRWSATARRRLRTAR